MTGRTPRLRFKDRDGSEFPKWEEKKLGEIAKPIKEKNSQKKVKLTLTNSAEYGVISQRDFFDKDIAQEVNIDKYTIVHKNDFIYNPRISNLSPCGPINKSNFDEGIASPLYTVFELESANHSVDFMDYYFNSNKWNEFARSVANFGARYDRMAISTYDFYNMPIPSPSLPEQQRIASLFSALDGRICAAQEKLRALQAMKKSLLQRVFSGELRFKDRDGSEFPKWEERRISEFSKLFRGGAPYIDKPEYWEKGTIPWMSSGEVNYLYVNSSCIEKKITKLGFINSNIKMVTPGSVVVAIDGQGKTRGKVAYIQTELCTNSHLVAVETDQTVLGLYLFFYLDTQYERFRILSGGDIRGGLTLNLLKNYIVPIPFLPEQQRIASLFSALDGRICAAQRKVDALRSMKKGLLQQMFV